MTKVKDPRGRKSIPVANQRVAIRFYVMRKHEKTAKKQAAAIAVKYQS